MATELILPDGSVAELAPDDYEVEVDGLGLVTAHANKADSRLIERFRRDVYRAVLKAFADETTEAENMLWNVLLSRYLDSAFGRSLDFLGTRVGESRNSQDDPDYRVRIRVRILINRSRGGPEDLHSIARALSSPGRIHYTGNASLLFEVSAYPSNPATRRHMASLLGEAVSAGVRLAVGIPATDDDTPLTWGSVSSPELGDFWASVSDPAAGSGVFAAVYLV